MAYLAIPGEVMAHTCSDPATITRPLKFNVAKKANKKVKWQNGRRHLNYLLENDSDHRELTRQRMSHELTSAARLMVMRHRHRGATSWKRSVLITNKKSVHQQTLKTYSVKISVYCVLSFHGHLFLTGEEGGVRFVLENFKKKRGKSDFPLPTLLLLQ